MPQPETSAWWSDVQHVRDSIERKREREARRSLRLDARAAARALADREEADVARASARAVADREEADVARVSARRDVARPGEIPAAEPRDGAMSSELIDGDDFEWATRPRRRFERAAPERRGRFAREVPAEPNPLSPPPRRRTVEITGHPVGGPTLPRLVEIDRRRPARRAVERVGPRPDRIALWAVVLGFFLILVAVTSTSHAATRATSARPSVGHTAHSQVVRTHTATLRANPPAR
jgi:hypothetical protein